MTQPSPYSNLSLVAIAMRLLQSDDIQSHLKTIIKELTGAAHKAGALFETINHHHELATFLPPLGEAFQVMARRLEKLVPTDSNRALIERIIATLEREATSLANNKDAASTYQRAAIDAVRNILIENMDAVSTDRQRPTTRKSKEKARARGKSSQRRPNKRS